MKENSLMIDIGRKYFSPQALKKLIQQLPQCGINVLQLHFSEDKGLGIDCPLYPWLAGRDARFLSEDADKSLLDYRTLTVPEVKEIVAFAAENGIEIIPSYDSPGHLNYTVNRFNEYVQEKGSFTFQYLKDEFTVEYRDGCFLFRKNGVDLGLSEETSGKYGISSFFHINDLTAPVHGTDNPECSRGIDLSNEAAVAFVSSVIECFGQLFLSLGCKQFDLGGDELLGFRAGIEGFEDLPKWSQLSDWESKARQITGMESAVAYDLLVLYTNRMHDRIKALGYETVRVWNDEFRRTFDTGWTEDSHQHVQFLQDYVIQYWSARHEYESPNSLIDHGYPVLNADCTYGYYVLLEKARCKNPEVYQKVNPECILKEWSPYAFGDSDQMSETCGWTIDLPAQREQLTGCMFCIWCDHPTICTDEQVVDEVIPLLKARNQVLSRR